MERIFKELVLTERAYVKDLASVMDVSELLYACMHVCVCTCTPVSNQMLSIVKLNSSYRIYCLLRQRFIVILFDTLQGYYKEMDPHSMDVPLKLRGKRSQVFGNLDEIYNFHSRFVEHSNAAQNIVLH